MTTAPLQKPPTRLPPVDTSTAATRRTADHATCVNRKTWREKAKTPFCTMPFAETLEKTKRQGQKAKGDSRGLGVGWEDPGDILREVDCSVSYATVTTVLD